MRSIFGLVILRYLGLGRVCSNSILFDLSLVLVYRTTTDVA